MRAVLTIVVLCGLLFGAEQVEVTAKRFEADQQKLVTRFFGNVLFKRGSDTINSQKAYIYFNKEKKPIKFQAIGSVKFELSDKGKHYKGHCEELIYYPTNKEYILTGNVYVEQQPDNRKIYADRATIDLKSGNVDVEAKGDRPVKLIFEVEEQ